jgi:2-polyprenyl-6-methoxyphenol hydroxylase-like FAD-dependent oxidoreductase
VLVVGGGVGGLSTAIALRQKGIDVLACERARELARVEVGAGITLWPNAMLILDRLGVGDEIRARGHQADLFQQRTWRGRLLFSWRLDELAGRLGAGMVGVSRPVLHSALVAAAGDAVRAGAECVDVADDGSEVTAELADGRRETVDVLVGADGLESRVRAKLLGDGPPRYTGLSIWRANVTLPEDAMPAPDFHAYWGPAAKFVWFRSGPTLLSWEGVIAAPPGSTDPPGESKQVAADRFAGWPDVVGEIIAATDPRAIIRTDVLDRPPVKRWGEGRVTLLGDAAHPMTFAVGQGAAQALEDAVVLARCLDDGGCSAAVLRDYEQQRMKRSAHFQNLAWRIARIGRWSGPVGRGVRSGFLRGTQGIARKTQEKDMSATI